MWSDSFQNINKWKNYEYLLKNYPIIIYKRPGFEITETYGADVTILDAPLLQISASFIRQQIKEKKSIQYLVPDAVRDYIADSNYFK